MEIDGLKINDPPVDARDVFPRPPIRVVRRRSFRRVKSISITTVRRQTRIVFSTGKRHVIGRDSPGPRTDNARFAVAFAYTYLRIPPDGGGRVHRSPISPSDDGSGCCIGHSFPLGSRTGRRYCANRGENRRQPTFLTIIVGRGSNVTRTEAERTCARVSDRISARNHDPPGRP